MLVAMRAAAATVSMLVDVDTHHLWDIFCSFFCWMLPERAPMFPCVRNCLCYVLGVRTYVDRVDVRV